MVDAFDMGNAYACLPPLRKLAADEAARAALVAAVSRPAGLAATSAGAALASWADVLRLYAAFAPGAAGWRSVYEVCELHPKAASRVDMRLLVHAGLLNGLLRRVHSEPVRTSQRRAATASKGAGLGGSSGGLEAIIDGDAPTLKSLPGELFGPASSSRKAASERRATLRTLLDDGKRCTLDRLATRLKLEPAPAERLVRDNFPDAVWIQR